MARMIYIFCWKDSVTGKIKSNPVACSNKRTLSGYCNMGYENLVRIFTRERRHYWEDDDHFILKIYEGDVKRGRQKLRVIGNRSRQ